jgi:hypothetical protein
MARGNGFTDLEREFIRQCIASGWTSDYCAKQLGRSTSGVIHEATKLGLSFPSVYKTRTYSRKYG